MVCLFVVLLGFFVCLFLRGGYILVGGGGGWFFFLSGPNVKAVITMGKKNEP